MKALFLFVREVLAAGVLIGSNDMNEKIVKILSKAEEIYQENLVAHEEVLRKKKQEEKKLIEQLNIKRIGAVNNEAIIEFCHKYYLEEFLNKYKFEPFDCEEYIQDIKYDEKISRLWCISGKWLFSLDIVHDEDEEMDEDTSLIIDNVYSCVSGEFLDCSYQICLSYTATIESLVEVFNSESIEEFMDKKYGEYMKLPKLLEQEGFVVKEYDYMCDVMGVHGYLDIGDDVYIKIDDKTKDTPAVLILDNHKYDDGDEYYSDLGGLCYRFEYQSSNDISNLISYIEIFKEEKKGNMGYFENGVYYGQKDVERFFEEIRDRKELYSYFEKELIEISYGYLGEEDCGIPRSYAGKTHKPSGLEICAKMQLVFNDSPKYEIGNKINKTHILFKYDKKEDDKNCVLYLRNYVYDRNETLFDIERVNGSYRYQINDKHNVGNVVLKGTFTELMESLKWYVYNMCAIHKIPI